MNDHQDSENANNVNQPEISNEKQVIIEGITGKVKWFNVKLRYGFVNRNDNNEDIFIHQSAIVKSNPNHPRKSVEDGEEILFDVVQGDKGMEVANVCAADGSHVKGSEYALRFPRIRGRGRGRGRGQPRPTSYENGMRTQEFRRKPARVSKPSFSNSKPTGENEIYSETPASPKEVLKTGVEGKVKWFNVKRGYGFVCRSDNSEDIFIHHSAITKGNPEHPRKSVEDGEEILFDVVKGIKGDEAANVCALDGNCVKGSEYALRYPRGRGRGRMPGRVMRGQMRTREVSENEEIRGQEFNRGGPSGRNFYGGRPPMRRGGRPFGQRRPSRPGPFFMQYRNQYNYDMPPAYFYDYYPDPIRGPRGNYDGRMFRGGPPKDGPIRFDGYDNDIFSRRPRGGRGRPRGRGRGRGRGWQDNNSKSNENEADEENEDR